LLFIEPQKLPWIVAWKSPQYCVLSLPAYLFAIGSYLQYISIRYLKEQEDSPDYLFTRGA